MKYLSFVIMAACFFPMLSHAETSEPSEHRHEKTERQHVHHLPKLEAEHAHSARESDQETSYVRITSNNTSVFEREIGSYSKYDAEGDITLVQITFHSKNLETKASVAGIAEIPVTSCENDVIGKAYIAYDGFEEGKWYTFKKDNSESVPLAFEAHICKILKST